MMNRETPIRLGFLSYVSGTGSAAANYRDVIELCVSAERLGLDSVWVTQHHFGATGGLPSPLLFLGAIAERTRRIALGTALITVPFESPLRVAEDAAVFETLHPGRLQLGLGTGIGSATLDEIFGVDPDTRRDLYTAGIETIRAALSGQPFGLDGPTLFPPAPALLDRIWEGPSRWPGVESAAERGSGLLLSRIAIGAGSTPSHTVQVPLATGHSEIVRSRGGSARVGLSRTIYPAASRRAAEDALRPSFEPLIRRTVQTVPELVGLSFAEHLEFANVHYGDPDDIVHSLQREPLIETVTDLIFQVQPADPSQGETLRIMDTVATAIAPRLGWLPHG